MLLFDEKPFTSIQQKFSIGAVHGTIRLCAFFKQSSIYATLAPWDTQCSTMRDFLGGIKYQVMLVGGDNLVIHVIFSKEGKLCIAKFTQYNFLGGQKIKCPIRGYYMKCLT